MAEDDELVPNVVLIQQDYNNVPSQCQNDNIAGSEATPIIIHTTSYTDKHSRIISDKFVLKQTLLVNIDTIFHIINCFALLSLNISVLFLYDQNRFKRVDLFWCIFVFSCISMIIVRYDNPIIAMISELIQCILYAWFSNWNEWIWPTNNKALISFSVLLFIMFGCKLLSCIINRFCVDSTSYILKNYVSRKRKNILLKATDFKCYFESIFIVVTTVPLFYFNQNRIWGEIWFAIVVVIILYYHQLMYVGILLYKDYYSNKLMDDIVFKSKKLNYNQQCDKDLFEIELRKNMTNEQNLTKVFMGINTIFTDTMMIPLVYDLMIVVLIIRYLIMYKQSEMTQFEFIYSIILCVVVGITTCCGIIGTLYHIIIEQKGN